MPRVSPSKRDQAWLCPCPKKKCAARWTSYHEEGDETGVFASYETVRRHLNQAVSWSGLNTPSAELSQYKRAFRNEAWYTDTYKDILVYFPRAYVAELALAPNDDQHDDDYTDEQAGAVAEAEDDGEEERAGQILNELDEVQDVDAAAALLAISQGTPETWTASTISTASYQPHILPEFNSPWINVLVDKCGRSGAVNMLTAVWDALGKRAALGTLMSVWEGMASVVHVLRALTPSVKSLGQLWRQSTDLYKDGWTCQDDHEPSRKGDTCPRADCTLPCDKQVFTATIKDVITLCMSDPEWALGARDGPRHLSAALTATRQSVVTSVWQSPRVVALDGELRSMYGYANGLTVTANYLPILVELFFDGFNVFSLNTPYSSYAILMRVLNLPPTLRSKYRNIYPLVLISGPKSPRSLMVYMKKLVKELNATWDSEPFYLYDAAMGGQVQVRVTALCAAMDTREHAKVQLKKEHPAKRPCPICSNPGYRHAGARGGVKVYRNCRAVDQIYTDNTIRVLASIAEEEESDKVRADKENFPWSGYSPLNDLPVGPSTLFIPDFMHAVMNTVEHLIDFVQPSIGPAAKVRPTALKMLLKSKTGLAWRQAARFSEDRNVLKDGQPVDWEALDPDNNESDAEWLHQQLDSGHFPWECSGYDSARHFLSSCTKPQQYMGRVDLLMLPMTAKEKAKRNSNQRKTKLRAAHCKDAACSGVLIAAMHYGGTMLRRVDASVCQAFAGVLSIVRRCCDRAIPVEKFSQYTDRTVDRDVEPSERGPTLGNAMDAFSRYVPETESRFSLHMFTHLFDTVLSLGPLRDTWSYPFESFFSWLKALVRNKNLPVASMARALNRISGIRQAIHYIKTTFLDTNEVAADTQQDTQHADVPPDGDWGTIDVDGEHDGQVPGTNVIHPRAIRAGKEDNGEIVELDSDIIRMLRSFYFPRRRREEWDALFCALRAGGVQSIQSLEDCLVAGCAPYVSVKKHARMMIADIVVRRAHQPGDEEGLTGNGDSYLTIDNPIPGSSIPCFATVEEIYEVCISTHGLDPFDHRLVLRTSCNALMELDASLRQAGMHWFDAYLYNPRLCQPSTALIDVSWIRQQVFYGLCGGEQGKHGTCLVMNKGSLTNMAVENPFGGTWREVVEQNHLHYLLPLEL